ncbi:Unknown protein, partial [Striga hermonthica]
AASLNLAKADCTGTNNNCNDEVRGKNEDNIVSTAAAKQVEHREKQVQAINHSTKPARNVLDKISQRNSEHLDKQKVDSKEGNKANDNTIRHKRPFNELFANNRKPSNGLKLNYTKPTGNKVHLEKDDIDEVHKTWGYCLVGYFTHRHPGREALMTICNSWKVKFEYIPDVNGWILFKFTTKEDRDSVLEGGPYTIYGRTLMLKTLPKLFRFGDDDTKIVPVWVQLPYLPLECWNAKAIGKIASIIGKPISTDKLTETKDRCNFARILVELDVSEELHREIEIETYDGDSFFQKVVYEYVPPYCHLCKQIGHTSKRCHIYPEETKGKKPNVQAEKTKQSRAKDNAKAQMESCHPVTKEKETKVPEEAIAPKVTPETSNKASPAEKEALEDAPNRDKVTQEKAEGKKPITAHCNCIYHLSKNIAKKYKKNIEAVFMAAAHAYTPFDFNRHMTTIQKANPSVVTYLESEVGLERWSRLHCKANRFLTMTSNAAETINSNMKVARELSITLLLECLRGMQQEWNVKNKAEAENTFTTLAKLGNKMLEENYKASMIFM